MQIRVAGAVVALSAAALSGCTSEPLPEPTSPAPTSTGVFASEAEALAAAEASYAAYLAATDEASQTGGIDTSQVKLLVSDAQYVREVDGFGSMVAAELHTSGKSKLNKALFQRWNGSDAVSSYACVVIGDVRVLDSDGTDVTPKNRIEEQTLEIDLVTASSSPQLLVDRVEPWSGSSIC